MFSLLPLRVSMDRRVPQYENQVIHFAGDYKNMYGLDAQWITKFERLLSRLCWNRAVVMLDFSSLRYQWDVPTSHSFKRYNQNPPLPPTQWSFKCFKMNLEPLPLEEAVEGKLSSPHHVADKRDLADNVR